MKILKQYKVKVLKPSSLKDYAGTNHEAARAMHFRPLPKLHEIFINGNLSPREKNKTIKHEIIEVELMHKKHLPYWEAHQIALKNENKTYKDIKKDIQKLERSK